jgi:hypothetical protein
MRHGHLLNELSVGVCDVAEAEADLQAFVAHGQMRWTAIPIKRTGHKSFAGRSIGYRGKTISIVG